MILQLTGRAGAGVAVLERGAAVAICLLACIYLAITAAACQPSGIGESGLVPVTAPELLRLIRSEVVPQSRRDLADRHRWSSWRRRHQYQARQARQRWNAYAVLDQRTAREAVRYVALVALRSVTPW